MNTPCLGGWVTTPPTLTYLGPTIGMIQFVGYETVWVNPSGAVRLLSQNPCETTDTPPSDPGTMSANPT